MDGAAAKSLGDHEVRHRKLIHMQTRRRILNFFLRYREFKLKRARCGNGDEVGYAAEETALPGIRWSKWSSRKKKKLKRDEKSKGEITILLNIICSF